MDRVISVKEHVRHVTPEQARKRKEICRRAAKVRWAKEKELGLFDEDPGNKFRIEYRNKRSGKWEADLEYPHLDGAREDARTFSNGRKWRVVRI